MLYYSNWFWHITFLSAVWLLYSCTFICMWCFFFTRDWTLNLMMLFIQWKFHEFCRQFASVNWISFLGILCRYLFKMLNIYAIDSEFEVKLWCTNTIPCPLPVLLLLLFLFYIWTKIAIMWHMCTCKWCLTPCTELFMCIVCVVLYRNFFLCICKISIQLLNLKVCVLAIIFQSLKLCVCCYT